MHPIEVISKVATFRKRQQQLADEKHALLLQLGWTAKDSGLYIKADPDEHPCCCGGETALTYEYGWAETEIKAQPVPTEPAPPLVLTTSYLVAPDIV